MPKNTPEEPKTFVLKQKQSELSQDDIPKLPVYSIQKPENTVFSFTKDKEKNTPDKMKDKEKNVATSIRLPESLKRDLERIAAAESRTLNNLMVIALRQYVRSYKNHGSGDS